MGRAFFRRRHLFEFEDQPWLPEPLRDYMTDALRGLFSLFADHTPVGRRLGGLLRHCDEDRIVDLCSGGGGALGHVLDAVEDAAGRRPRVLLTDKYPNLPAWESLHRSSGGRIAYDERSVDAQEVPDDLEGVRTLFAALHHFRPAEVHRILRDAAASGRGLAVFEASERHPVMLLALPLVPVVTWLVTPFLRPFRLGRIVFTYLLPIVPFLVFWDGVVSCFRTYTPAELEDLAEEAVEAAGVSTAYRFEVGQDRVGVLPLRVTWLVGRPDQSLPPRSPARKRK